MDVARVAANLRKGAGMARYDFHPYLTKYWGKSSSNNF